MIHRKKIWPEFFKDIVTDVKPFDVRKEEPGESPYAVGDILQVAEWDPEGKRFSGKSASREITYVLRDERFLPAGTVVLGLKRIPQLRFELLAQDVRRMNKAIRVRAEDALESCLKDVEADLDILGLAYDCNFCKDSGWLPVSAKNPLGQEHCSCEKGKGVAQ